MHSILPASRNDKTAPQRIIISPKLVLGTTSGLVKRVNEDRIGYKATRIGSAVRLCLADGHWGGEAAQRITHYWLTTKIFPTTAKKALSTTKALEEQLFGRFGVLGMDPEKDFTPEASFVALELTERILRFVAYGDCRLMVVRQGKVRYEYAPRESWLGAFSYLKLRGRQPIETALVYERLTLQAGDTVLVYSDGVDECVYQTPTITSLDMAGIVRAGHKPEVIFDTLMEQVSSFGAEDNASLAVLKA